MIKRIINHQFPLKTNPSTCQDPTTNTTTNRRVKLWTMVLMPCFTHNCRVLPAYRSTLCFSRYKPWSSWWLRLKSEIVFPCFSNALSQSFGPGGLRPRSHTLADCPGWNWIKHPLPIGFMNGIWLNLMVMKENSIHGSYETLVGGTKLGVLWNWGSCNEKTCETWSWCAFVPCTVRIACTPCPTKLNHPWQQNYNSSNPPNSNKKCTFQE